MTKNSMPVARAYAAARAMAGLSQIEVARLAGVSQGAVSRVERGAATSIALRNAIRNALWTVGVSVSVSATAQTVIVGTSFAAMR